MPINLVLCERATPTYLTVLQSFFCQLVFLILLVRADCPGDVWRCGPVCAAVCGSCHFVCELQSIVVDNKQNVDVSPPMTSPGWPDWLVCKDVGFVSLLVSVAIVAKCLRTNESWIKDVWLFPWIWFWGWGEKIDFLTMLKVTKYILFSWQL